MTETGPKKIENSFRFEKKENYPLVSPIVMKQAI
jgi:hypothetical protein